jgi:hypothetical protein
MNCCDRRFYSLWRTLRRVADSFLRGRQPILSLVSNLSYRNNARLTQKRCAELNLLRGNLWRDGPAVGTPSREASESTHAVGVVL